MQFLLSQCHLAFEQHSSVLFTLLLAGLVSGLTHCAGMCGPFVAAQVGCGSKCDTQLQRLSGVALLPYHLGRMTTYMTLGVIAALLSKQILGTPLQHWLAVCFLVVAGVVFIMSALPKRSGKAMAHPMGVSSSISLIAAPLMRNPRGARGYMLGAMLGLLPCGVIFAALMVVSTTGSPFTAALAMAFFTLGTFPALFLVGVGSRLAYKQWPQPMRHVARGIMIFNGCNLLALAGKIAW